MKENKHFVYILKCGDGTYYTGYTTDVQKRLITHEMGKGAKYTRGRAPLSLVYESSFSTKSEALKAERAIKKLTKAQKKNLIDSGESK
ncbi:GIY-YIG nuclease family protein [Thalassorhabdus alkalitolerans]|uniref:GIY-YIG nuclease family protein n=1 Tax=Thalassorhabdus alkalitolerans TaxID=2282697 RepID=A0ABW0YWM3_9BACI|nr:GIY-YIG nuclease family protein [Thalassobacillus sp. C254]